MTQLECTRSHPHDDMDRECELRTEIARLTNELARLRATPAPAQDEPFGYFRAEPFGWTDCEATDEGAIALYEHPAADLTDELVGFVQEWLTAQGTDCNYMTQKARAIIAKVKGVDRG